MKNNDVNLQLLIRGMKTNNCTVHNNISACSINEYYSLKYLSIIAYIKQNATKCELAHGGHLFYEYPFLLLVSINTFFGTAYVCLLIIILVRLLLQTSKLQKMGQCYLKLFQITSRYHSIICCCNKYAVIAP